MAYFPKEGRKPKLVGKQLARGSVGAELTREVNFRGR